MSIKQIIIQYLEEQGDWTPGGKVEDYIRSVAGHKSSNASRRCRELCEEGVLDRRLRQINNRGPKFVEYRILREPQQGVFIDISPKVYEH